MANLGLINKNAGNLRDPATGDFQVFKNDEAGRQALINDLNIKKSGKSAHIKPGGSILDLANVWAPASDNNKPQDWANNVAKTVGKKSTDSWADIPTEDLANGIQVAEGTSTPNKIKKAPTEGTSLAVAGSNPFTPPQDTSSQKQPLNRQQMIENIQALEKQGASQTEIQSYIDERQKSSSPQSNNSSRKTFADSVKNIQDTQDQTQTPEEAQHSGTLGTNPNDSVLGKLTDNSITRGLINLVPGAKTVGDYIGTSLGGDYQQVKDTLTGSNNYNNYDKSIPSPGELAKGSVGVVGSALSAAVAPGLVSSAKGLLGIGSKAIQNPEIAALLKQGIQTREGAIARLTAKLGTMGVSEVGGPLEQNILKALKELAPTLAQKQNLLSTFIKKGISLATQTALINTLGNTVGGFIHKNITK